MLGDESESDSSVDVGGDGSGCGVTEREFTVDCEDDMFDELCNAGDGEIDEFKLEEMSGVLRPLLEALRVEPSLLNGKLSNPCVKPLPPP